MKKIAVLILILTILANITSFGKATKKTNSDVSVQNQETLGSRYDCIDYNGNIYLIAQEGLSEYQNKLLKVIDTWNPNK